MGKYFKFLIAISVVMVSIVSSSSSNGQTPGSWTKVKIGQYGPVDFAFADSLHGILVCNRLDSIPANLVCFATSDGGKSWELTSVSPRADLAVKFYWTLNGFQSPKPGFGSIDLEPDILGGELAIQADTFVFYPTINPNHSHTSAEKMYSPQQGCRFVCIYDSNGNLENESFLRVTHDGWRSFDSAGRFLDALALDATILDSDNIWAPANGKIFHYYGGSWHTIYPEDSSSITWWDHIECGMTRAEGKDEVYSLGGGLKTDFDYSDNGGSTWERHSKFGGRIYSLAATSPSTVWCFVGNAPPNTIWLRYRELKLSHHFADTIYYSTDHGNSWLEDSTTFSGAAMMQMHWVDPRHGFVSTLEFADTCFMYRYEAPSTAGVLAPEANESRLRILTSPVLQQLSFSCSNADGASTVRVFDLLGRTRVLEHRATTSAQAIHVDVQSLPPGYYMLSFSDKVGTSTQGFIKQ